MVVPSNEENENEEESSSDTGKKEQNKSKTTEEIKKDFAEQLSITIGNKIKDIDVTNKAFNKSEFFSSCLDDIRKSSADNNILKDLETLGHRNLNFDDIKDREIEGKGSINDFLYHKLKDTNEFKTEHAYVQGLMIAYKRQITKDSELSSLPNIITSYDSAFGNPPDTNLSTFDALADKINNFKNLIGYNAQGSNIKDKINKIFSQNTVSIGELVTASKIIGILNDKEVEAIKNSSSLSTLKDKASKTLNLFVSEAGLTTISNDLNIINQSIYAVSNNFNLPTFPQLIDTSKFNKDTFKNELQTSNFTLYQELINKETAAGTDSTAKSQVDLEYILHYLNIKGGNLGKLIYKLSTLNYDFSLLNATEQSDFINEAVENNFTKIIVDNAKELLGLNDADITAQKKFLKDLLDPNINAVDVDINATTRIRLPFKNKTLKINAGTVNNRNDFEDVRLVFDYELEITDDVKKSMEPIYKEYEIKFAGEKLNHYQKVKIKDKATGQIYEGYPNRNFSTLSIHDKPCQDAQGDITNSILQINEDQKDNYEIIPGSSPADREFHLHEDDLIKLNYWFCAMRNFEKKDKKSQDQAVQKVMEQTISENFEKGKEEKELQESEKKEELEKLKKDFKYLDGDKNREFKEGAFFYLGIGESWLGGMARIRAEIIKINLTAGTYDLKLGGIENDVGNQEGKVYTRQINLADWSILKQNFYSQILKINKLDNIEDFHKLNQKGEFEGKRFADIHKAWGNLQCENNNFVDQKKSPIKYIGKKYQKYNDKTNKQDDKLDVFEIKFTKDKVHLKGHNMQFDREMSYTDFFVFINDKKLEPWSEEEYKLHHNVLNPPATEPFAHNNWTSWAGMISQFKLLKDNIVNKAKYGDELRNAIFYNNFVNSPIYSLLAGTGSILSFGFLSEVFNDIQYEGINELDSRIYDQINKYKKKLDTIVGEQDGVHAKQLVNTINNEVLNEKPMRNPLKACAFLLYSLEKGGGLYFRSLSKYAGQGIWVKAIAGETEQKKYLNQTKELTLKLLNNPSDGDLQDKLAKLEIMYIANYTGENKASFGSKLGTQIETLATTYFDKSKIEEIYNNETKKASFDVIYTGFNACFGQQRSKETLGALKALSDRVQNNDQYKKFYGAMILPMLTGITNNNWDHNMKLSFKALAKTVGLPIGLYVSDYYGPEKIATLLDYACIQAGIPDQMFSKSTGWNFNKIQHNNYNSYFEKDAAGLKKLRNWWDTNSDRIIPILNLQNFTTVNQIYQDIDEKNTHIDGKTKKVLKDFIKEKMLDKEESPTSINEKIDIEGELQKHGIRGFSSGFAQKILFDLNSTGDLKDKRAASIWNHIKEGFTSIVASPNISPHALNFIMNKYKIRFKSEIYGDKYERIFLTGIHEARKNKNIGNTSQVKEEFQKIITSYCMHKKGDPIQSIIEDTMDTIVEAFAANIDKMDDEFLKELFGKENFEKYYNQESADEIIPTIENPKQKHKKGNKHQQQEKTKNQKRDKKRKRNN